MTTVLILYRTFTATKESASANAEASKLSSIDVDFMIRQANQQVPGVDYENHVNSTISFYRINRAEALKPRRKRLLCSTFTKLTSPKMDDVLRNVVQSNNQCDWVVVIYDFEDSTKDKLVEEFRTKLEQLRSTTHRIGLGSSFLRSYQTIKVEVEVTLEFAVPRSSIVGQVPELCKTNLGWLVSSVTGDSICSLPALIADRNSIGTNEYNDLMYPKSLLFLSLLPHLKVYENVWLLDDDLSLSPSFDLQHYLRIWQCSSGLPPLVSQPLIAESTQTYKYLNSNQWRYSSVLSSTSGFIEIQAPLVNAAFFEWYLVSFVMPLVRQSSALGADWGFDSLLCKAAESFLSSVVRSPSISGGSSSGGSEQLPCMIVVGSPPLHHTNSKVTNSILGYDVKKKLNKELMRIIEAAFPSYTRAGKGPEADPLHAEVHFRTFNKLQCDETGVSERGGEMNNL